MAQTMRDPGNVMPLADYEVFVTTHDDPKIGKDGVFPHYWISLGILADGSKIEEKRTVDQEEIKGAGFGVIATSTKPGDVTGTVEVLEENDITDYIAYPDRYTKDGVDVLRHTGKVAKLHFARVRVYDNGDVNIRVTRAKASATLEDTGRSEKVEGRQVSFKFYPDKTKAIFEEYTIKSDGTEPELEKNVIRFVDAEEADELVNDPQPYKFALDGATGGTWSLTAGPYEARGLAHDANSAAVQKALRDAGDADVTVTGDASTGFIVKQSNGPVSVDTSGLEGGGFPKSVEITNEGS